MNFTTTTELARKGKKAFDGLNYATVLSNNKNIGMIIGKDLSDALLESGVLQQIKEELWENQDDETIATISEYRKGHRAESISFDTFKKEYHV